MSKTNLWRTVSIAERPMPTPEQLEQLLADPSIPEPARALCSLLARRGGRTGDYLAMTFGGYPARRTPRQLPSNGPDSPTTTS
ncbi:hypothetical protein [Kitasatospora sp. HPMI-4]|uniref:hypothetical protein n=1 Tax=Kitasatospora sp. HPMI-4 TaxID=3448443 RepID=UPI003F19F3C0